MRTFSCVILSKISTRRRVETNVQGSWSEDRIAVHQRGAVGQTALVGDVTHTVVVVVVDRRVGLEVLQESVGLGKSSHQSVANVARQFVTVVDRREAAVAEQLQIAAVRVGLARAGADRIRAGDEGRATAEAAWIALRRAALQTDVTVEPPLCRVSSHGAVQGAHRIVGVEDSVLFELVTFEVDARFTSSFPRIRMSYNELINLS